MSVWRLLEWQTFTEELIRIYFSHFKTRKEFQGQTKSPKDFM